MEEGLVKMVFAFVAMAALSRLLIYVYYMVRWKPERMREALRKMKKMKQQMANKGTGKDAREGHGATVFHNFTCNTLILVYQTIRSEFLRSNRVTSKSINL